MKRNLTGEDAYLKMIGIEVPAKTETYTPIAHTAIIDHMRKEVMNAKFIIIQDDYKCTADTPKNEGGQVGVGMMQIRFREDDDLVLMATFVNSYNKQVAFRFALGAQMKVTGNSIILQREIQGFERILHRGTGDILSVGTITSLIEGAEDYWNKLVAHKNLLKGMELSWTQVHDIIGELYLQQDLLAGYQLNLLKSELSRLKSTGECAGGQVNGWHLYNAVAEGIKDTHPADWMDTHARVHGVFNAMLGLEEVPVFTLTDEERDAADANPPLLVPLPDEDEEPTPVAYPFPTPPVASGGTGYTPLSGVAA